MSQQINEAIWKARRVILTCETDAHLKIAEKYLALVIRLMPKSKKQYFGSHPALNGRVDLKNYEDRISVNELKSCLKRQYVHIRLGNVQPATDPTWTGVDDPLPVEKNLTYFYDSENDPRMLIKASEGWSQVVDSIDNS